MIIYILNNSKQIAKQTKILSNKLHKNDNLSKSHSGVYTVFAVNGNGPVGVDIERKVYRSQRTIQHFFSKYKSFEIEGCTTMDQNSFYKSWTAMESYYKMCKKGFYTDKRFCLNLKTNTIRTFNKMYYISYVEDDDYIISVCTEGKDDIELRFDVKM